MTRSRRSEAGRACACCPRTDFTKEPQDYIDGFVAVETGQIVFSDGRFYDQFRKQKGYQKWGIHDTKPPYEPGVYRLEIAISQGKRTVKQRPTHLFTVEIPVEDGRLYICDPANVIAHEDWPKYLAATDHGKRFPKGVEVYVTGWDATYEVAGSVTKVR